MVDLDQPHEKDTDKNVNDVDNTDNADSTDEITIDADIGKFSMESTRYKLP